MFKLNSDLLSPTSLCSSLATDITQKNSSTKFSKEELEPAMRAVLMMLLSPSQYIFSEVYYPPL